MPLTPLSSSPPTNKELMGWGCVVAACFAVLMIAGFYHTHTQEHRSDTVKILLDLAYQQEQADRLDIQAQGLPVLETEQALLRTDLHHRCIRAGIDRIRLMTIPMKDAHRGGKEYYPDINATRWDDFVAVYGKGPIREVDAQDWLQKTASVCTEKQAQTAKAS